MISNNLKKRIEQVKLYDANGSQTMLAEEHVRTMIGEIPKKDLRDPTTMYCDPQCGTGTILLILADVLMTELTKVIPDENKRIEHIFTKQIYGYDIDHTQVLLAQSNIRRAVNDNTFQCNVDLVDCFKLDTNFNYVISNLDYGTMNNFIPKWRTQCDKLIITGRANKNSYTEAKITELTTYKYLAKTRSETLLCMMVFDPVKKNSSITIKGEDETIVVDNPPFLPNNDIHLYKYALEVLNCKFETYKANYGRYYRTDDELKESGNVPLIFNVGKYNEDFADIVYASESVVNEKDGIGKHKIVVSKNGIHGYQSVVKYASPKYGTGHNALWISINNKTEFKEFYEYYTSEPIKMLCVALKVTNPANGTTFWNRLPKAGNYAKIKKIYDKYYR